MYCTGRKQTKMKPNVKKITTLTGHSGPVYTLAKGKPEEYFYTGSSDKFAAQWNTRTLKAEKFAAAFPAAVYSICYIAERDLLLAGTTEGKIHILDLSKKEEIKILQHHTAPVFDIKYCMKTNCFYTAGGDGCIAVCSLETLSLIQLKRLCNEKVRNMDFTTGANEMAVASGDCRIRIFDLVTLREKHVFEAHQLSANVVKYSPDGTVLLSGGRDAHLKVWSTSDYSLIKSIPAHNYAIYDIAFSPGNQLFATASRDKTIKLWNAETFDFLIRISKENFEGHINSVNKLLWNNDYLVSVSDDRTVMIWDITF